jgi:hypothetical protein
MRVQLRPLGKTLGALGLGLWICAWAPPAQADGSITMRGAYYKEKSTRVMQPMLDADLDVGDAGQLKGHTLVDAITSASAASGASGKAFTERRVEGGLLYMHRLRNFRLGGGGRYSTEPDYQSTFVNLRLEAELAKRNTTLALNLARGSDSLDNSGSQGGLSALQTGSLTTNMVSLSASQLLSPESIASVSYDLMQLDGFQENIYRTVVAGGMIQAERVPDSRLRHALAANVRYFLDATSTTFIGAYRFYTDDWDILSSAPELRIVQDFFDDKAELHLSYRYYRQRSSFFYKDVYDSADMNIEPYLSDDDKLGRVRSHTLGVKAATRMELLGLSGDWADVRLEALVQYLKQDTHYGNALVAELALSFPIQY